MSVATEPDLEFLYVGDPMCSWCWGFAPVLERLDARFHVPLQVIAGGLRPGAAAEPLDELMRRVLINHWQAVEERSGQPFDLAVLDRDDWIYDTLVPDTAVVTMRTLNEPETLAFFARLQRSFYAEAVDITDPDEYPRLLEEFDVDTNTFIEQLASAEMATLTYGDFQTARRLGVNGFPTLLLRDGDTAFVVTRGYLPYEPLESALRGFLEERHPQAASRLVAGEDGV